MLGQETGSHVQLLSCKSNIQYKQWNAEGLKELYKGHEIAVHTLTHQDLTKLDKDTVYNEVFLDKQNLERMFGCQITGMAYPYGTYNDEVVQILKKCKIQYARSVVSSGAFKLQKNLLIFKPTCHHADENIWELLEKFLKEKSEEKQLFYIWGHSYEFDVNNNWKRMEEILDRLIGHNNIFYGIKQGSASSLLIENKNQTSIFIQTFYNQSDILQRT